MYLARQRDLDRLVALKELRMPNTGDPSFARRFLREARLAGSLSHPNIVTVHEYFEWNRIPYIAMEYLPHGSLRPYVGGMTLSQFGGVLEGVLAGLGQAETHHIVHRDIKPENLLLTGEGRVKIADFGIAKPTNAAVTAGVTSAGLTVGTPNYIAPEQAMARTLGPWTDLYSVGITAFEMLVGRTPFGDTTEPMAVVMRQVNEPVPLLRNVAPQIDGWIADWVAWLVSKAPADRPQSASDAWEALEEALIAVLGPRWRRETRLQQRGARTAATASLRRPTRRAATAMAATARAAATTPPLRTPRPTTPAAVPRRSRHVARSLAAASLVAMSIAALKFGIATMRAGDAPSTTPTVAQAFQPAVVSATTAATTTTTPPVPSLASQVAPAEALAKAYERAARAAAKQPGSNAKVVAVLEDTARSYHDAADAAARNDPAGYSAAIATADARRTSAPASAMPTVTTRPPAHTTSTPQVTVTVQTTPDAQQPAQTQTTYVQPTAPSSGSSCAGDSSSDDPSDDSCGNP